MKLSTILLPVDFSERGNAAAKHAATLTRQFGAELTLLHVNPFPSVGAVPVPNEFGGVLDAGWITAMEAKLQRELEAYRVAEFHDIEARSLVVSGDPARRIVEYVHRQHPDLIVMATHGYGPFRRFLLGSVTAKVLHDVDCPVWTGAHLDDVPVRPLSQEGTMARQILCAIDNGPASERLLTWTADFAAEVRSPVALVHAIPKMEPPDDCLDAEGRLQRIAAAKAQARCLQRKAGLQGTVCVEEEEPGKAVAAVAARLHADLVVIGRSPQSALGGRLRTDAYSIIRQSPCPVVSV